MHVAAALPRTLVVFAGLATMATLWGLVHPYFPNAHREIAGDFAYFFPRLYDGALWLRENGPFAIPWFTPSFCGGLPTFANPQDDYFALPQILDHAVGPLAAIQTTAMVFGGLAFVGGYRLARDVFAAARGAAAFAGSLFALNGFYVWRMVAGHLAFHPVALVPLVAWGTLAPAAEGDRRRVLSGRIVLAGIALAYVVAGGALQHLPLVVLSVVAIALLGAVATGASGHDATGFAARLAIALAIGLALVAGKLAAVLSFIAHAPRELYSIPGVRTPGDLVELVLVPLAWRPRMNHLAGAIVNTRWSWNVSEFELGVGPLPFAILVVGAVVGSIRVGLEWAHGSFGETRGVLVRRAVWAGALAALLAAPLVLDVYRPGLGAVVKAIPILRSMHAFFRYDALFIPVLVLGSALVVSRLVPARAQWAVGIAAVAFLVASDRNDARLAADYGGGYVPDAIELAHADLARTGAVPPITTIGPIDIDGRGAFARGQIAVGVSAYPCYEPMFGYLLETFPKNALHTGPITDETTGAYNLLDPSCFVFPEANGCAPGDRIRVEEKERFERLRAHQPLPFARPWWQTLANAVSLLALAGLVLFFGARLRARRTAA